MSDLKEKEEWIIYLKSILSDDQIEQLKFALQNRIPILISGPQIATGKSVLKKVLTGIGFRAFEEYEMIGLELNEPIKEFKTIDFTGSKQQSAIYNWINDSFDEKPESVQKH